MRTLDLECPRLTRFQEWQLEYDALFTVTFCYDENQNVLRLRLPLTTQDSFSAREYHELERMFYEGGGALSYSELGALCFDPEKQCVLLSTSLPLFDSNEFSLAVLFPSFIQYAHQCTDFLAKISLGLLRPSPVQEVQRRRSIATQESELDF